MFLSSKGTKKKTRKLYTTDTSDEICINLRVLYPDQWMLTIVFKEEFTTRMLTMKKDNCRRRLCLKIVLANNSYYIDIKAEHTIHESRDTLHKTYWCQWCRFRSWWGTWHCQWSCSLLSPAPSEDENSQTLSAAGRSAKPQEGSQVYHSSPGG